jgi:hypothetical protein
VTSFRDGGRWRWANGPCRQPIEGDEADMMKICHGYLYICCLFWDVSLHCETLLHLLYQRLMAGLVADG